MVDVIEAKRALRLKNIFRPGASPNRTSNDRNGSPSVTIPSAQKQHPIKAKARVPPTQHRIAEGHNGKKSEGLSSHRSIKGLSPPPSKRNSHTSNISLSTTSTSSSSIVPKTPEISRPVPPPRKHGVSILASNYHKHHGHTSPINHGLSPISSPLPALSPPRRPPRGPDMDLDFGNQNNSDAGIRRNSCSLVDDRNESVHSVVLVPDDSKPVSRLASPAAATITDVGPRPVQSKSTPLRNVKAYNVYKYQDKPKLITASHRPRDPEKQRKMQELEDLISGRRRSTVKLSLTPKVVS